MTEPDPQPSGNVPTMDRDWTTLFVGLVVVIAVLWVGWFGDWLSGRTNGRVLAPPPPMCAWFPAWFAAAIWLLVRVRTRLKVATTTLRTRYMLLLAAVSIAPVLCWIGGQDAYSAGFASWVKANVNVPTVQQWGMIAPLDPTREAPEMLAHWSLQGTQTIPVPRTAWPESLARLEPDEVGVFADRRAVVLWWTKSHVGFGRLLVITASNPPLPPLAFQPAEV